MVTPPRKGSSKIRSYRVDFINPHEVFADTALVHSLIVQAANITEARTIDESMNCIVIRAYRFDKKLGKESKRRVALKTLFSARRAAKISKEITLSPDNYGWGKYYNENFQSAPEPEQVGDSLVPDAAPVEYAATPIEYLATASAMPFTEIMAKNVAKLKARYGDNTSSSLDPEPLTSRFVWYVVSLLAVIGLLVALTYFIK